jgi:predicted HicB family RNase H-like nuclease
MSARRIYETPRLQTCLRFQPRDWITIKQEAATRRISVNRLVEIAVQDWIMREADNA